MNETKYQFAIDRLKEKIAKLEDSLARSNELRIRYRKALLKLVTLNHPVFKEDRKK